MLLAAVTETLSKDRLCETTVIHKQAMLETFVGQGVKAGVGDKMAEQPLGHVLLLVSIQESFFGADEYSTKLLFVDEAHVLLSCDVLVLNLAGQQTESVFQGRMSFRAQSDVEVVTKTAIVDARRQSLIVIPGLVTEGIV